MTSLLQLIGRFHTPATYAMLKNYLAVKNKSLLVEASVQLAGAGQAVSRTILLRLAADPAYRMTLYDRLKEKNKTALFPVDYLKQAYFAESDVYNAADDDEGEEGGNTEKIEFLSKRTAAFDGRKYSWYLYKVTFTGEDGSQSHLGVGGGYTVGGTELQPKKNLTGVYWKDDFDNSRVSDLFQAFLETRKLAEEE